MRKTLCSTGLAAVALMVALPGWAQHEGHGAGLVRSHVPREVIERPVALRDGIGTVRHQASTGSPEAQAFYEQGLAYLHSYVWLEAARSFNQALRHDPELALAYVGLSRALSGLDDPPAARRAQARAEALAPDVSDRERRWIAARSRQLDAIEAGSSPAALLEYLRALESALENDPGDAELWTLRGNAEEPLGAAGRGQRGGAGSIAFYKEALRRVPGHFGAHHYLIHSYENIGDFASALRHGEIYAGTAFRVPHALHMYGHDLMKTGRVEDAIDIFGRARQLEHEYYESERIARDYDWHHSHNTTLLALSHRHMGRLREAERLLRDAASVQQGTERRAAYYRGVLGDLLIATGKHEEVLPVARELARSSVPMVQQLGHALAARAHLKAGRPDAARPHVESLQNEEAGVGNMYGTFVGLEVDVARGEYLVRTSRRDEGTRVLAAALHRARQQRTPDGWIEGLFFLETIFQLAHEAGESELARRASDLLMDHDGAYGGSHLARGLLAELTGDQRAAESAFGEAARLWSDADDDFGPIRMMRERPRHPASR